MKKKVLYISDPGTVGGAARALEEVVLEVKKMGFSPIVCVNKKNDFSSKLEQNGVETLAINHFSAMTPKSPYKWKRPLKFPYEAMKYYLTLPYSLHVIEKNVNFDEICVVHTNSSRNDIGCLLNKKYGLPHIMHIREFGQEDFDCCIYRPRYYQYISRYTNKFLAVSKSVADAWCKKGIDSDKTQVLYDGIDIKSIEYNPCHDFNHENLKIIMAGGICEAKGQHIAIQSITQLPSEVRRHISLDIAGWSDPRYVKKLEKLIIDSGIEDRVHFIGVRDDLYKIYQNYDIGITCSRSEGFGRVTAEYLYAGLGVIGSDTGATPELVQDHKTGLLFKYPDSKMLASCILFYYYDRNCLQKYAYNGHQNSIRFSAERNAQEIINVYEEISQR